MKTRERDIDLLESYNFKLNPSKVVQQKTSSMVYLLAVLILLLLGGLYMMKKEENKRLEENIENKKAYMTDAGNLEILEYHKLLLDKIKQIENYNQASDEFLQQLAKSERFSSRWINFFNTSIVDSIGVGNDVTSINYKGDSFDIECIALSEDLPRQYAEYLTNYLDEEGNKKFPSVVYTDFKKEEENNTYKFSLTIQIRSVDALN